MSAAAIGIALLAMRRWSQPAATLVVVSVFAYVAVVWAFAIWNRRGTWRSLAESSDAFLAISIRRCRRGLRSARFVVAVVVVQLVGAVAWSALGVLTGRSPFAMTPRAAWAFGLLAGLALAFFGWAIRYRRRMIRELAWLVELRRGLAGEG